jgi:flagellar M-ring protein FliF
LIREQPRIHRISLAVMVDGSEERAPDGTLVWKERSPEDLARIATLVRSAIGFDEKRGDHVEIVNMRFTASDESVAPEQSGLFGLRLEKSDLVRLAESGLLGLIGLVALLVVVRPMVIRLSGLAEPADTIGMEASFALASGAQLPALTGPPGSIAAGPPRLAQGAGGRGPAAEPDDEGMINIAHLDGQMRASSLRKIGELVEKHPDEALAMVRAWLSQEQH